MDTRSHYRASQSRMAEFHRQAAAHRTPRQAHDGEGRKLPFRRWLAGLLPHRDVAEAPAPVAVKPTTTHPV